MHWGKMKKAANTVFGTIPQRTYSQKRFVHGSNRMSKINFPYGQSIYPTH